MCESVTVSVWTWKKMSCPTISAEGTAVGAECMEVPRSPFHGLWTSSSRPVPVTCRSLGVCLPLSTRHAAQRGEGSARTCLQRQEGRVPSFSLSIA